jgi:hypothetical protein
MCEQCLSKLWCCITALRGVLLLLCVNRQPSTALTLLEDVTLLCNRSDFSQISLPTAILLWLTTLQLCICCINNLRLRNIQYRLTSKSYWLSDRCSQIQWSFFISSWPRPFSWPFLGFLYSPNGTSAALSHDTLWCLELHSTEQIKLSLSLIHWSQRAVAEAGVVGLTRTSRGRGRRREEVRRNSSIAYLNTADCLRNTLWGFFALR